MKQHTVLQSLVKTKYILTLLIPIESVSSSHVLIIKWT